MDVSLRTSLRASKYPAKLLQNLFTVQSVRHVKYRQVVQINSTRQMLAVVSLRDRALCALEQPAFKKVRRVAYHVVRGAKKFAIGSGNAAWVVGTTMLVMVMPLVFEIDREQQLLEYEGGMGVVPPVVMK